MRKQIDILSIPIDVVTMNEAIEKVSSMYGKKGLHIVATANAEMIMQAQKSSELAKILHDAALVVPDGAGALWAAEQIGEKFPERVTGFDLAVQLLKRATRDNRPVYLLGAAPGVVDKALDNFQREHGELNLVGKHSGYFSSDEEEDIIESIKKGGTQLVLVAMGVPKQEFWIKNNLKDMDGLVAIGVGGTFDVLAGNVVRAPKFMQENRLEWLYRLIKEPKRFKRMLALPKFMWAVKKNK